MPVLFLILGAVLVVVIALVSVGRVVARMATQSRPAIYELPDAVDWIADRLPDEVTARISYADVARILEWHLDWFAEAGLSSRYGEELGGESVADDAVGVEDAAVEAVVARSLATKGAPEPVDVVCVLDLQMKYFEVIGAIDNDDHGNAMP